MSDTRPDTGRSANLIATGAWSEPVSDARGNRLRGRLLVYEGRRFTNALDSSGHVVTPGPENIKAPLTNHLSLWLFAPPVYLEIQNLNEANKPATQFCFDVVKGLHFDLRNAKGAPTDNLKYHPGGGTRPSEFWAAVPAGGTLRLHANSGLVTSWETEPGPKAGDLNLAFRSGASWLLPASDTNSYFLSCALDPRPTNSTPSHAEAWQGSLEFPKVLLRHRNGAF